MFSRSLSVFAAAALIAGIVVVSAPEAAAQRHVGKPKIRQIKPIPGDTVRVGDTVLIEWEFIDGSGGVLTEDQLHWCEQGDLLSLDGGSTIDRRITIRLDPTDRTQEWVVPNTPTDAAVLDIHYGCEADGLPHEVPNVQKGFRFKIVPGGRKPKEISMKAMPKDVSPGDKLELQWETDLDTGTEFDVQVSFNRGAEWTSVGKTTLASHSWNVPKEYAGNLSFRVVASTPDGRVVESPTLVKGHRMVTKRK